ncbi:MAG: transglycosylase domain-containing protein [Kofleriaceae bacterium]|nr:transglycosylase domain-containing protein [Kofleriaceae bacterium]
MGTLFATSSRALGRGLGRAAAAAWRLGRRLWRLARWPLAVTTGLAAALVWTVVAVVALWPLDPARLRATGAPLVVTDRHGEVLATVPAPGGRPGADAWVPLAEVPSVAVAALIASEDHGFWDHAGVDGRGLARAAWLDLRAGRAAYGGSTLTMQLARLAFTQGEPRTLGRKVRETVHALRIERAVGKREILEQWLNRAYFGNGAWGIDAAARTYFGKPVAALSTAEAVLLVCLPRAPTAYDPLRRPAAAVARRDRVLDLMVRRGALAADEAARRRASRWRWRGTARTAARRTSCGRWWPACRRRWRRGRRRPHHARRSAAGGARGPRRRPRRGAGAPERRPGRPGRARHRLGRGPGLDRRRPPRGPGRGARPGDPAPPPRLGAQALRLRRRRRGR